MYTPHKSVLYVRICRCTVLRCVHKSTPFPIATDRFSNETFPSNYCEDEHRQSILIYLCYKEIWVGLLQSYTQEKPSNKGFSDRGIKSPGFPINFGGRTNIGYNTRSVDHLSGTVVVTKIGIPNNNLSLNFTLKGTRLDRDLSDLLWRRNILASSRTKLTAA